MDFFFAGESQVPTPRLVAVAGPASIVEPTPTQNRQKDGGGLAAAAAAAMNNVLCPTAAGPGP